MVLGINDQIKSSKPVFWLYRMPYCDIMSHLLPVCPTYEKGSETFNLTPPISLRYATSIASSQTASNISDFCLERLPTIFSKAI